jgi:hypothetical protein
MQRWPSISRRYTRHPSFANNVLPPRRHARRGLQRALTTVLNNYGRKIKMLKDDDKLSARTAGRF